jgi:RimJ/RimL family protein N-acetyltransferase
MILGNAQKGYFLMINRALFEGENIRLTALDAKEDAPTLAAWTQDGRYISLSETIPPHPLSPVQAENLLAELLREADEKRDSFWFGVRTLDESELLGLISLEWVDWSNGTAYMMLSMKDLDEYGRSSTEEALAVMKRYVFLELQMHRLGLTAPSYNQGLLAVLHKLGFVEEVRQREMIYCFGRRWDNVRFGILAADWEEGIRDE